MRKPGLFCGKGAFSPGCESLSGITIPVGASYLGESVFEGCLALTGICYGSGEPGWGGILEMPRRIRKTGLQHISQLIFPDDMGKWL
ncbi:MAG: hypothetical protein HFH92_13055 [Lachnospiraceae bacterium]|nr:hypothetical protein [uncultured Acetatifactor sp.]MCI8790011.1 hypothetical protein [Lachnospiraceae bacterium]